MHVKAKEIAVCGLMLAISMICIMLGSVIETNTLFLLAAASYCEGVIIREYGFRNGIAFLLAGVLLGIMISPNKFYVISYGAMVLYIFLSEALWEYMGRFTPGKKQAQIYIAGKYMIFNIIYISIIFAMKDFILPQNMSNVMWIGIVFSGQIGLWIYDKGYQYFQGRIWEKLRRSLRLSE